MSRGETEPTSGGTISRFYDARYRLARGLSDADSGDPEKPKGVVKAFHDQARFARYTDTNGRTVRRIIGELAYGNSSLEVLRGAALSSFPTLVEIR